MTTPSQGVIAHLSPDDAAAAIAFYEKAFGAEEVMRVPAEDGRRLLHAEITTNGVRVFLMDHFPKCRSAGKRDSAERERYNFCYAVSQHRELRRGGRARRGRGGTRHDGAA